MIRKVDLEKSKSQIKIKIEDQEILLENWIERRMEMNENVKDTENWITENVETLKQMRTVHEHKK